MSRGYAQVAGRVREAIGQDHRYAHVIRVARAFTVLESRVSIADISDLMVARVKEIVTGHTVFLRPSHSSSREICRIAPRFRVHRDVKGRDRILTRVGTGGIPELGNAS